jgi:hypothetical protein
MFVVTIDACIIISIYLYMYTNVILYRLIIFYFIFHKKIILTKLSSQGSTRYFLSMYLNKRSIYII